MSYNDRATHSRRVSRAEVVAMLHETYGISAAPATLDRWLRAQFGRGI